MSNQTAAPPLPFLFRKPMSAISVKNKQLFEQVYVKPILDKIEKGAEWVMNMPTDRFDFEISVANDSTEEIKVALFRKYLDKAGKPMLDPKTKQPVVATRKFLSAPFVLHNKSKVNGLGDKDEESPFAKKGGQEKASKDTRKVMTTSHPFADLVAEGAEKKHNGWLKHQFKVMAAFRQAVAELFLDHPELSLGPDMKDGQSSECKIALDEARKFPPDERPAALARLFRRFGDVVKVPGETEWNPATKTRVKTGKKKSEDEAYMVWKAGPLFPKKDDYKKPDDEPEEHPDPAIREHVAKMSAKVAQVYQYPKIYQYNAAHLRWEKIPPVEADSPELNTGDRVGMVSFTVSAFLAPGDKLAIVCYWDKLFLLGEPLIPVPKLGPSEAAVDINSIEDEKIREELRRMQEEAQAEERSLVVQTDLKRLQEDAQAEEAAEESALALKRAKQVIDLHEGTDDF